MGLFASKEQELEQRAMLIKRLSFTLFCSEKDQHQKYLQQIQGNVVQNVFQKINSWLENGMLQHSFGGSVIFLSLQHFIILKFIFGLQKCNTDGCWCCAYTSEKKEFKSSSNNSTHKSTNIYTCNTVGVVYLITCRRIRDKFTQAT